MNETTYGWGMGCPNDPRCADHPHLSAPGYFPAYYRGQWRLIILGPRAGDVHMLRYRGLLWEAPDIGVRHLRAWEQVPPDDRARLLRLAGRVNPAYQSIWWGRERYRLTVWLPGLTPERETAFIQANERKGAA